MDTFGGATGAGCPERGVVVVNNEVAVRLEGEDEVVTRRVAGGSSDGDDFFTPNVAGGSIGLGGNEVAVLLEDELETVGAFDDGFRASGDFEVGEPERVGC